MLRAFSTAATGMDAQQTMVDTIANNLANINTTGFKRTSVSFQDLLYLKLREASREISSGQTAPSGLEIGSGVKMAATNKIFTEGQLENTGRDKDVAIQGDGFFKVLLPNGEERYTRDGSFQTNADGELVTASGYRISPEITIPSTAISTDIAEDGTVSVLLGGEETSTTVGTLELYRFPNNAGLSSDGQNLYRATEASGSAISGTPGEEGFGSILSNYLEKSNVQMVNELINLITAQRGYEINSRTIRVGDNMLRKLNMLIR